MAGAQSVHGVLRVVKGDVKIKTAASGQTVKARIGEKVFPKDVVMTAVDSRAKIVMVDNNEINVSPESQVEIQNYEFDPNQGKKNVLLNVIYGKVRAKVEQKYDGKTSNFQIKTPSAVAGVRGTDFMVTYIPATNFSSVVTFHGSVAFGIPGPGGTVVGVVFVTPGTIASNTGNSNPTDPVAVPTQDLAKMDSDSKGDLGAGTPPTPGAEPRLPAGDKKDGEKAPTPPDGASNGSPNGRAPAADTSGALPPPPMVQVPPEMPKPPVMPTLQPMPPAVGTQPDCQFCRGVIESGPGKVIIKVNNP